MSLLFNPKNAKAVQNDLRTLFELMSSEFRDDLMHTFSWSEDVMEKYLNREATLKGDVLKDVYSHLQSLLSRIKSFASDKSKTEFPVYENWVEGENLKCVSNFNQDKGDLSRLLNEGVGVFAGNNAVSPDITDDQHIRYDHLKTEFDKIQKRSNEAIALMDKPEYKNLQIQSDEMYRLISSGIGNKR